LWFWKLAILTVALILARVVPDGESFEPRFSCLWLDMAETICERGSPTFYLPDDTLDGIPIPVCNHPESVAVLVENIH
jgi:hypothetical protein